MIQRMRALTTFTMLTAMGLVPLSGRAAAQARGGNCVAIGTPKPSVEYNYRLTDSRGTSNDFTTVWDEITPTASRSRTTRGRSRIEYVSRYRIVDDVSVIEQTVQGDAGTTTFAPGVVGDPFGRACTGRSWPIASATATNRSARGAFSAQSDAGEMKMLGIHVSVTVPAGTFDTIHYTRTTRSAARGAIVDEYWKSIEHGVVVKHLSAMAGVKLTEELQSIR